MDEPERGYCPEEVTGWAFGLGVERIAMLKYGIDARQGPRRRRNLVE